MRSAGDFIGRGKQERVVRKLRNVGEVFIGRLTLRHQDCTRAIHLLIPRDGLGHCTGKNNSGGEYQKNDNSRIYYFMRHIFYRV